MTQTDLWHEAASMAARAHRDHTRSDEKRTPYFSHPVRVALTLAVKFGCTDDKVLAAALLHDVLEDTRVDYDDLLQRFDKDVADLVAALSKDNRLVESHNVNVISGANIPMLLRILNYHDMSLEALAEKAASGARDGIVVTTRKQAS